MPKKTTLGKSMDALFNHSSTTSSVMQKNHESSELVRYISIDQILPSKHQPRTIFDEEKIESLAQSIKSQGIIQPLVVTKDQRQNIYQIIAGERRWRAAKTAGLQKVPVLLRVLKKEEASLIALVENIQREDLNPIERAKAIEQLSKLYGLKQQDLAEKLGFSRTYLSNTLRLLKLSPLGQKLLKEEKITEGHAKILCSFNSAKQEVFLRAIVKNNLTVRQLEQLAQQEPIKPKAEKKTFKNNTLKPVIDFFEEFFSMKVAIEQKNKNQGKVTIFYNSIEELEGMIDKLGQDVENRF
jgi:ParB family chromosome partitioning protein